MIKRVLKSIFSMCKTMATEINENRRDIIEIKSHLGLPTDPYCEFPTFDDPFAEWDTQDEEEGKEEEEDNMKKKMRRTTTTPSDPAATTLPFWCLIPKGE
jgi:hypothetical protein